MTELQIPPRELPAELPDYSVVLDRDRFAWQRLGGRWFRAGMRVALVPQPRPDAILTWVELLDQRGPLRVVVVAESTSEEP